MSTTNFDQIISMTNAIEADYKRKVQALDTVNAAMHNAGAEINELIHFIQKLDDKPISQNERLIIQNLRNIFKTLNEAAVEIRFEMGYNV